MNYVTGVVMGLTSQNFSAVIIKARGKFISRAVDVSEMACHRFLKDSVRVEDVRIGSDVFKDDSGKEIRVSSIEITLRKIA